MTHLCTTNEDVQMVDIDLQIDVEKTPSETESESDSSENSNSRTTVAANGARRCDGWKTIVAWLLLAAIAAGSVTVIVILVQEGFGNSTFSDLLLHNETLETATSLGSEGGARVNFDVSQPSTSVYRGHGGGVRHSSM